MKWMALQLQSCRSQRE